MEWNYLSIPHFTGHVITRPCWETLTWIILQLKQQNCVRLCSRPWLPWGLLGLGLWYEACRVECVLFSLRVVVTPTISQPFTTPLILSTNLQNLKKKSISALFAADNIHWYIQQWHSLKPMHIACICQEITVVATRNVVTFGVETHSSLPIPWPHSGIGVNQLDPCERETRNEIQQLSYKQTYLKKKVAIWPPFVPASTDKLL